VDNRINNTGAVNGNIVSGQNNQVANSFNNSLNTVNSIGLIADDIKKLFESVYSAIEARSSVSPAAQDDLKAEVQEVQSAVTRQPPRTKRWMKTYCPATSVILHAWPPIF